MPGEVASRTPSDDMLGGLLTTIVMMQGDILSAVLVVFVLSIELAHPSLEGFAFKLQACVTAVTVGALYMVLMQRGR